MVSPVTPAGEASNLGMVGHKDPKYVDKYKWINCIKQCFEGKENQSVLKVFE